MANTPNINDNAGDGNRTGKAENYADMKGAVDLNNLRGGNDVVGSNETIQGAGEANYGNEVNNISGFGAGSGFSAGSSANSMRETAVEQADYSTEATENNFNEIIADSVSYPVLLFFYEGKSADDKQIEFLNLVREKTNALNGVVGLVICDMSEHPVFKETFRIQLSPTLVLVLNQRPLPLAQGVVEENIIDDLLSKIEQIAVSQGLTGRAKPSSTMSREPGQDAVPPAHKKATEALNNNDINLAISEYEKVLKENPKDALAKGELCKLYLLKRLENKNILEVRKLAGDNPDDINAQLNVADMDLSGGKIEDACLRLIDYISTHKFDKEAVDSARERLLEYFEILGNQNQTTLLMRRKLATVLY